MAAGRKPEELGGALLIAVSSNSALLTHQVRLPLRSIAGPARCRQGYADTDNRWVGGGLTVGEALPRPGAWAPVMLISKSP